MSFLLPFLALVICMGHAFSSTEKVYTRQVMLMKKVPSQLSSGLGNIFREMDQILGFEQVVICYEQTDSACSQY